MSDSSVSIAHTVVPTSSVDVSETPTVLLVLLEVFLSGSNICGLARLECFSLHWFSL